MSARTAAPDLAYSVQIVRDPAEALALAAEWDHLADRCGAGPFPRPDYALSWWQHVGSAAPRSRLLIVAVRRGGVIVGLAPLHERHVGPLTVARWLGHGLGTVAEALVAPDGHENDTARRLWEAVLDGPTTVAQLVECREHRSGLHVLGSGLRGCSAEIRVRDACPILEVTGDTEQHLAGPERRRIRRTVRVVRRRLAEAGTTFRVEVASDLDHFEALLPSIRSVFDAAELVQPRQHLLRPPWGDFTVDYLRTSMAARRALAFVGHLDERPVSFDLVLLSGRTMHAWICRFDPATAAHSPGHLLRAAALDWAVAHGYSRIDLLLGDSVHKRQWATGSYATLDVTAGRRAVLPAAKVLLRTAARRHADTRRGDHG